MHVGVRRKTATPNTPHRRSVPCRTLQHHTAAPYHAEPCNTTPYAQLCAAPKEMIKAAAGWSATPRSHPHILFVPSCQSEDVNLSKRASVIACYRWVRGTEEPTRSVRRAATTGAKSKAVKSDERNKKARDEQSTDPLSVRCSGPIIGRQPIGDGAHRRRHAVRNTVGNHFSLLPNCVGVSTRHERGACQWPGRQAGASGGD
jgi:hypothetical protein